ncbi:MAG: hypothetical protein JNG84_06285 [Archangium sp.]|nr:hypothetical protein [Archangium sp.]
MGLLLTLMGVLAQSPSAATVMDRVAMQERLDFIDTELRAFQPVRDPAGGLLMGLGFGAVYLTLGAALVLLPVVALLGSNMLAPVLICLGIIVAGGVVGLAGVFIQRSVDADAKTRREVLVRERDALQQQLDAVPPSVQRRPLSVPLFTLARF